MARRELGISLGAIAVLALITWLISFGGHLKVKAQAEAAMDSGVGSPGPRMRTGTCPPKWAPHVPAGAHMGRHRMYRHPGSCSPVLTAPQQVDYDWLYSPPAQGDL